MRLLTNYIIGFGNLINKFKAATTTTDKVNATMVLFAHIQTGVNKGYDLNLDVDLYSERSLSLVIDFISTLDTDSNIRIVLVSHLNSVMNGGSVVDVNAENVSKTGVAVNWFTTITSGATALVTGLFASVGSIFA